MSGDDVLWCTDTFDREYGDRVRALDPSIDILALRDGERVSAEDIARITIAFFSSDAWPERASAFMRVALDAPRLEWLHTMSAGIDSNVFARLADRGVAVTTSSGASAPSIARTVIMHLLALSRDLPGALRAQANKEWSWRRWNDLDDIELAVVGFGPIGQEVARLAVEFGMRPTIVRREAHGDEGYPTRRLADLRAVVADSGAVVLALPLTDETRGIVSREVIASMGNDAYLVNVGRGALVDQEALTEAILAGRIGGAALDVFAVEPLPADDPLWSAPNLIITPHNSGSSTTTTRRANELFLSHLARRVADRSL